MASPTFDETYEALRKVCDEAQKGLYRLGQIRGRNDLQSEKELRFFVVATSKMILNRLPCLLLECDAIEHEDSRYCTVLTRLENGNRQIIERDEVIEKQAARIHELEAALVEERAARYRHRCVETYDDDWCIFPKLDEGCEGCPLPETMRSDARKQLIAEDKIGNRSGQPGLVGDGLSTTPA